MTASTDCVGREFSMIHSVAKFNPVRAWRGAGPLNGGVRLSRSLWSASGRTPGKRDGNGSPLLTSTRFQSAGRRLERPGRSHSPNLTAWNGGELRHFRIENTKTSQAGLGLLEFRNIDRMHVQVPGLQQ